MQNYQSSFDATEARYDSGLASLFELEDARRTLFAAQTARVALQRERTEAWVALYRATGGGWDARLARAATATEPSRPLTPDSSKTPWIQSSVPPSSSPRGRGTR